MRVHIVDVGGVRTRYYHAGEGAPVLLVHGIGMTSDSWCRNIEPLGEAFSVYAPDLLDNGFTEAGAYRGGPPHNAILDHLVSLVDHLGLDCFSVIGSSFGALIGLLLYFRVPHRIRKLVIVSSGSALKEPEELMAVYRAAYQNGRAALANPTLETCRSRMAKLFHDPSAIPRELLLLQLNAYALPNALASYERRLKGMMDLEAIRPFCVRDRLGEVSVPILAVWGKQDPRSDYEEAIKVIGQMPNARIVIFDNCGHLPHVEQPDRFNSVVTAFLIGESETSRREEPPCTEE